MSVPNLDSPEGLGQPWFFAPTLARLTQQAIRMGHRTSPVLIAGDTGSRPEREWLARTIHNHSRRANATFIKLSWEFLTESFVEMQLFGADRTGPPPNATGFIRNAEGGTLYIEDLTRFSIATQSKLATFLDTGRFTPTNSQREELADVRLLFGAVQPPESFEQDLNVHPDLRRDLVVHALAIPPLRERPEEIAQLAQQRCQDESNQSSHPPLTFSPGAADTLANYTWPENIEELARAVKMAAEACAGDQIEIHDLPPSVVEAAQTPPTRPANLRGTLERIERSMIIEALQAEGGNQTRAAKTLGISERLMGLRVRKYALNPKNYRTNA